MRVLSEAEKFCLGCDYIWMESWKEEIVQWFEENKEIFDKRDVNPFVFYILEDANENYSTAWLTIGAFKLDKKIVGIINLFSQSGEIVATLDSSKPELIEFYKETLGNKLMSHRLWGKNGLKKDD